MYEGPGTPVRRPLPGGAAWRAAGARGAAIRGSGAAAIAPVTDTESPFGMPPSAIPRVALVKSAARAESLAAALAAAGFHAVLVSPFVREEVPGSDAALRDALADRPEWIAVTSPGAAPALGRVGTAGARVAAVGMGTATALASAGAPADVVGDAGGDRLAERMRAAGLATGSAVVHPCGEGTRTDLGAALSPWRVRVADVPVYRVVPDPIGERAAAGEFDVVVIGAPPLAARATELFPARPPAVAIGRTTASMMRDLGWVPAAVAARPRAADVVNAVRRVVGGE